MIAWLDALSRDVLSQLIDAAVRGAVLAAFAGVLISVFRVRPIARRLVIWRMVAIAALLMPLGSTLLPELRINIPVLEPANGLESSGAATLSGTAPEMKGPIGPGSISVATALFAVYLAGVFALILRSLKAWLTARPIVRHARQISDASLIESAAALGAGLRIRKPPQLVETDLIQIPMTTGVLRPVVVLPAGWRLWEPPVREAVLLHELSHVRRHDTQTRVVGILLRAMFWASPLAWWLPRHLTQLAEEASDEAALSAGVESTAYAGILVDFMAVAGRERPNAWQVSMIRTGRAERRVDRILTWKKGNRMSRPATACLYVSAAIVTIAATSITLESVSTLSPSSLPGIRAAAPPEPGWAAPGSTMPLDIPSPEAPAPIVGAPTRPADADVPLPQQATSSRDQDHLIPDDGWVGSALRVGSDGLTAPEPLVRAFPKYTAVAMRAKVQGEVLLQIVIDETGNVSKVRVLRSLDPDLDEQAVVAAKQWRFRPALLNELPAQAWSLLTLEFKLH